MKKYTDERVDTAVGEGQHHGEVVEPAAEVEAVAEEVDKEQDLVGRPADDQSAANNQRRDYCIASRRVRSHRIHLYKKSVMR